MMMRVGQRPIAGVVPVKMATSRQHSHKAASCSWSQPAGLQPSGWMDGINRSSAGLGFHSSVSRSLRAPGRSSGRVQPTRMMFERFTEKAIKVVMLAQEEARRLGHNFVGTEQVLLGLIGESTGIAAKVLKSLGVTLKDARVEVEKIIGRGSGFVAVEIPFTPRAKRVLELSLEEARQLGEHLVACQQPAPGCRSHCACARSRAVGLTRSVSGKIMVGDLPSWCRPQLHRYRAHPAWPASRG